MFSIGVYSRRRTQRLVKWPTKHPLTIAASSISKNPSGFFKPYEHLQVMSALYDQYGVANFRGGNPCLGNSMTAARHPKDPLRLTRPDFHRLMEDGYENYRRMMPVVTGDGFLEAHDATTINSLIIEGEETGFSTQILPHFGHIGQAD